MFRLFRSIPQFAAFLEELLCKGLDLFRLAEVALDVVVDLTQATIGTMTHT